MSRVSIVIQGKDLQRCMLELEKKIESRVSLLQKILFAAMGTLEKTLSLLTDSETEVQVLEQNDLGNVINRSVRIVQKKSGYVLVTAKSSIFPKYLPYHVIRKIRKKQSSIGEILDSEKVETFKSLHTLGYDSSNRTFFRTYQIICKQNIALNIEEIFLPQLFEQIKVDLRV
jgi:chorismate-pyruvate lyase